MTAYDRAVDRHLDHTEENPDGNCYFCRQNGWAEKQEKKETNAYTRGMLKRMRTDYSVTHKKLQHLELEMERELELRNKFNTLDEKLSKHDDKYDEYKVDAEYPTEELSREIYEVKKHGRREEMSEEKKQKISELQEELIELQQKMDDAGRHESIRNEKIAFNKAHRKLERMNVEPDQNRKVVGGDEASGYGKQVV